MGYSSALAPTYRCSFVAQCIDAWELYEEKYCSEEFQDNYPSKKPQKVNSIYWWLAQEAGIDYYQGSLCSIYNYDQCAGKAMYIPWVPGMEENILVSNLPGTPDDIFYSQTENSWITPDNEFYGLADWWPLYQDFKEALYE